MPRASLQYIATGILFAILWSSASVAGKFGIRSVEPLVFFTIRFLLAGAILLLITRVIQRSRAPRGKEWLQVSVFGLFNTTLYLGLFVIALQFVTPGITTLAIALNPLLISVLSAVWMKRAVSAKEMLAIGLGMLGIAIAVFPLLQQAQASPIGLVLIGLSMLAYSFGSVYYASVDWQLTRTTINAWQVFIGGILIAPVAWLMHARDNEYTPAFWFSLAWLIVPVSIIAVQLWLRILKTDAVRASLWLYLCPIFGFLFSYVLLDEPLTLYTLAGTALVMTALYIGQKK